jgi:hypothetical protein
MRLYNDMSSSLVGQYACTRMTFFFWVTRQIYVMTWTLMQTANYILCVLEWMFLSPLLSVQIFTFDVGTCQVQFSLFTQVYLGESYEVILGLFQLYYQIRLPYQPMIHVCACVERKNSA